MSICSSFWSINSVSNHPETTAVQERCVGGVRAVQRRFGNGVRAVQERKFSRACTDLSRRLRDGAFSHSDLRAAGIFLCHISTPRFRLLLQRISRLSNRSHRRQTWPHFSVGSEIRKARWLAMPLSNGVRLVPWMPTMCVENLILISESLPSAWREMKRGQDMNPTSECDYK